MPNKNADQWEHHCLKCNFRYRSPILKSPCRKCRRYSHRMVKSLVFHFEEYGTRSLNEWKKIIESHWQRRFADMPAESLISSYLTNTHAPDAPSGMYCGVEM